MKLPPRYVTVLGILISVLAVFTHPDTIPTVAAMLGENPAAKLAAIGTLIAAMGRALIPPSEPPATP